MSSTSRPRCPSSGTCPDGHPSGPLASRLTAPTVRGMRNRHLFVIPAVLAVAASFASPVSAATPVAAPVAVTATARPAAVAVTFTPAPGVVTYELNCVASTGASISLNVTTTDANPREVLVTNLAGNVAHACKIRGAVGTERSAWVNSVPAIVVPAVLALPATPSSLVAEPQIAGVKLRFATVAGADFYTLRCAVVGKAPVNQDTIVKQPAAPAQGTPFTPVPLEAVITGLGTGSHTCQITATNNAGTSPAKLSAPFTPLVSQLPAPSSVAAVPGDGSATVSFAPVTGATGYTVACVSKTGKSVTLADQKTSPVVVPGLTNGTVYRCSVYAVRTVTLPGSVTNEISVWASAPEFTPNPPKPTAPVAPTLRSIVAASDYATRSTNITATFGFDPSAGTPSTYTLRCTGVTDQAFVAAVSGVSPLVLPVPADKTYRCVATATNTYGTSPESAATTIVVPPVKTVPDAPTVSVKKNADYTSTATFRLAPFPGATAYRVTCESGTKSLWVPTTSTVATLKLPLGRWNCTTAAQMAKEVTGESAAVSVAVVPAKPKFTRTSNSVTFLRPVGWTDRWLVSCRADVGSASRSGNSAKISLLLPKGTFDCRVYVAGIGSDPVPVKI
jgi:hypothetical protein